MPKKLISLALTLLLALSLLPSGHAAEPIVIEEEEAPIPVVDTEPELSEGALSDNGSCGANLSWSLEGSTLTISGSGPMTDWSEAKSVPWYGSRGKIKTVAVKSGVSTIGAYAFYDCENLSSVTLPKSLSAFGYQSFRDCIALKTLTIPENVSDLGSFSFYGSGLKKLTVPGKVKNIVGCFAYCGSLETVVLKEGLESLDDWAFRGCYSLKSVTLPDSLESIGAEAFRDCVSLSQVELPPGLREIGLWAFCGSGLRSLSLPEGMTALGERAFENCRSLSALSLPDSLTELAYMSFYGCSALPSVALPASLKTIGDKAFGKCGALSSVSFGGSAPQIAEKAFIQVTATVYYPSGQESWSSSKRQNYGGSLSWRPYAHTQPPALRVEGMSTEGVSLSWSSGGFDRYELQRSDGGGGWLTLKTLSSNSYTDPGAQMGVGYGYRLRARGDGVWTEAGGEAETLFNPFTDIPSSGKTLEYVAWAYNSGIVKGSSATRFAPDKSCTRIQFIMMLWKLAGSPAVGGTNPFSDISGDKTTKAILWALDRGIINSGRRFDPEGSISRVQVVMILWKLAGSPEAQGDNPFADVSGAKTTKAVLWAYQKGIAKGTGSASFSPDRDCTRVQLVIFLYKYNGIYSL